MPWITSLRPLNPTLGAKQAKKTAAKKSELVSDLDSQRGGGRSMHGVDMSVPPGFYEDDMLKWNRKF